MTVATQKIVLNDIERLIELDFVRATESAALNAYRYFGKGDPLAAHAAAVDALRGALDTTSMKGTVVMRDGMNPHDDGFQDNEQLGNSHNEALAVDLGFVPIDGVDLVGWGIPGAMCVLVAASRSDAESNFARIPCRYMEKMAYGPAVHLDAGSVHLNASARDNLEIVALKLGKRIQDLSVVVLERTRHEELIEKIRQAGASVRLITDGDVAACLAPCFPETGIDVYMGIGGGDEAVMSAAAIKCIGGNIQARVAPVDDEEKQNVINELGEEGLNRIYHADDLTHGDNVVFCATAISDSNVLKGIHVNATLATTYSMVMRSRYRTVRYIKTAHDLTRKKIRLHTANAEVGL